MIQTVCTITRYLQRRRKAVLDKDFHLNKRGVLGTLGVKGSGWGTAREN